MDAGPPKGCVPLLWPDGIVRLASDRALRIRPEFYRQNKCVKYDGPWPPPMNSAKPVKESEKPLIIVPSYLEADARRAAKAAAEGAREREEALEQEESEADVSSGDEPDEEADGSGEEG